MAPLATRPIDRRHESRDAPHLAPRSRNGRVARGSRRAHTRSVAAESSALRLSRVSLCSETLRNSQRPPHTTHRLGHTPRPDTQHSGNTKGSSLSARRTGTAPMDLLMSHRTTHRRFNIARFELQRVQHRFMVALSRTHTKAAAGFGVGTTAQVIDGRTERALHHMD